MDLGSRGLADLGNLYKEICEAKNIRGNDSEEQKKRLEKKRGMKLDDHPQYKKEEKDPFGRPGGKYGGVPKKGSGYDKAYQANMKKIKELEQKEEVEQVAEADSLAAMAARREKRLAAQRKREGTTASGRDFGRDDSLSADQQKKRREAEFKAGIGTKKEELEASGLFTAEEIDAILEADVQFEGMHRDAKTGEVVDKAEIGKTYYPNMPKKKTSVALRKEKESQKK